MLSVSIPSPSQARIGELFSNNNFLVPLYQRNYSWSKNEVIDFWEDLLELVEGKRSSHFFGQIVTYCNQTRDQEIIDGQQRITTSIIFLAAIRDIAQKMYNDNFRNTQDESIREIGDTLRDIRREADKSIKGNDGNKSALIVQDNMQPYFFNLTHSKKVENLNYEPKKKMREAYQNITKEVNTYLKTEKELKGRIDKLRLIFDSFVSNFYVVMIAAPTRRDSFTIFETLNSRGRDLTASDIIKNHLMSILNEDLNDSNEKWNQLAEKLNNSSDEITKFIRVYWASKKRIVPEAKLYREISSEVDSVNEARKFLEDLLALVELYSVLVSPTSPRSHLKFFQNRLVLESIDVLNHLGVKLYYPVIMAMYYNNYHEEDILKVTVKITQVFVRHRTIINDGTNKLENGFSDVAHKIWNYQIKTVEEINREMSEKLLPSSEATKVSFSVLKKAGGQRGPKKWTLVYLLAKLYEVSCDDFAEGIYTQIFDDDDFRLIQIGTDDRISEYKELIGNWTILEKKLSNKEFKNVNELIKQLSLSKLNANRELAETLKTTDWNQSTIKQRQQRFTSAVTAIW